MILDVAYANLVRQLAIRTQDGGVTLPVQLLKIQEEAGEAAEAYIGHLGLNRRKGMTHTSEDLAMELADVVITALVGIEMMGYDLNKVLAAQADKTRARLDSY